MKIVYCIPACYNSGGMERVLATKANYLAEKSGYEVTIITTGQKGKEPYFHFSPKIRLIDLGINYDDIEGLPIYKKWTCLKDKKKLHKQKLGKVLLDIRANIVISMFTHETSFLYKIKDGSIKILELHFSKHFRDLHNKYNHANILKRCIGKILNQRDFNSAKKYDRFVVLTHEDKKAWKGFSNIEVISNPIPFVADEPADSLSKNIIAIGRLCPQKGFDLLIDIWSKVDESLRQQWHLTIYGSGPDYDTLMQSIEQHKLKESISICNPVKDIIAVYKKSSIMCFTSRYEGFGMALTEAMSCGVACISFNCPCGPSEIILDNYTGRLIQAFDTNDFAAKLTDLMQDENKRSELGKNAFHFIRESYNIDTIMNKWLNLFSKITQ